MVSHQLDVLRVPRSILGEANHFAVFFFFFLETLESQKTNEDDDVLDVVADDVK